jgi:hypothetical protein
MEDKKIFKVFDNFAIAEALDAIALGIPIPAKIQKTFELQPDNFIIWQKLVALSALIPAPGAASLLVVKVPLTAAQIMTLNSIPVLAIPAPGVGKAIEIISGSANLIFNTTAYTSSSLRLQPTSATGSQFSAVNLFLSAISTRFSRMLQVIVTDVSVIENEPINITSDADSVVGDSPINIYISYRIITL